MNDALNEAVREGMREALKAVADFPVSIIKKHDVRLTYYTSDDGVYLACDKCSTRVNLGFSATPSDAVRAEMENFLGDCKR